MQKKSCQIALFSSKTVTKSLKPYTVFFYLQSCVNLRLYKLGHKWLLTVTETNLKDKGKAKRLIGKTKGCQKFLSFIV